MDAFLSVGRAFFLANIGKKDTMRKIVPFVIIFIILFWNVAPVFACEPPPTNNPVDCKSVGKGYQFGLLITGARNGKYPLSTGYGRQLIGGAPQDKNNFINISNSDLHTFNWDASLGIDAVIIQAGGQTKVKKLSEEKSGKGYHGAADWRGKPYKVEKAVFCYDYELSISNNAEGVSVGGPAAWNITKKVAAAEKAAFAGEKATFDYTVAVQKVAGGDSGNRLTSEVKIKNATPLTATLTSVGERLNPGDVALKLDCGDIHFPYRLSPGKELTCTTSMDLASQVDGSVRASVRTYGNVGGASSTANIAWSGTTLPGTGGNAEVTVTDTNAAFGGPFKVTGDQSWTYAVELACPTDPGVYTDGKQTTTLANTAAIAETNQSASQSVTLQCYAPTVSTSAGASYDLQYAWDITKTGSLKSLTLQENETANVDYVTTVSVTGTTQTNVRMAGFVTIGNPHPGAPLTADLIDEMAPGTPAPFSDCTSPLTIPAGQTVTCHFDTAAEAVPAGDNTVQVVMNGITFGASAPFTSAKNEIDECVTVTDTAFEAPLGTVCADKAPATFPYSVAIGPYPDCRETSYLNTAEFVTNDTGATDYATWELPIVIECPIEYNCVRTIKYWVSHADKSNPATYNATWDKAGGPDTPFYTTGSSWLQILSGSANNTYLRLAQAYIAANLNTLWGAVANDAVSASLTQAETLLADYATNQSGVTGTVATDFKNVTTVLSNFNRGVLGAPICADCQE